MSILDPDYFDAAESEIKYAELEHRYNELLETNKSLQAQVKWYEEMMFDWKRRDEYHVVTRNQRLSEAYHAIYGDAPLCDWCDNKTGFFLMIDHLCNAILGSKWLLRIFRWCGYKPHHTYLELAAEPKNPV